MKIKYCTKYEKYVSQYHCELFNNGQECPYYTPKTWSSIKELLTDPERPKWEIGEVIKPLQCKLLDKEYYTAGGRRRRSSISTRYKVLS
jgi:hypothetical protein